MSARLGSTFYMEAEGATKIQLPILHFRVSEYHNLEF